MKPAPNPWAAMLAAARTVPIRMERGIDRAGHAARQGAALPTGPTSELGAHRAHERAVRKLLREQASARPSQRPTKPQARQAAPAARITPDRPLDLSAPRPIPPSTIGQDRVTVRNLNVPT